MSRFRSYLENQQKLAISDLHPADTCLSKIYVVIPCYDEDDMITTLSSLERCHKPESDVSVLVVVNSSVKSPESILQQNQLTIQSILHWMNISPPANYHLRILHAESLPSKWAGVGWARKIGMDEAVKCLENAGLEEGILVSFDADSTASANYLTSIENTFKENPTYNFVNLYFEHNLNDPSLSDEMRTGIILYELYLRYLRNAMEGIGYPHAIHTVGSSFAVKASSYVKQGGMNRRQAGEDFHFLHKIVLLGSYGTIHDATVYPSSRISERVPFGTGAALKKWKEGNLDLNQTYSLKAFETLTPLLSDPGKYFTESDELEKRMRLIGTVLQNHVAHSRLGEKLLELKNNCSDEAMFSKRFYHLLNAFWIIQYLNIYKEEQDGAGILQEEAGLLLTKMGKTINSSCPPIELLTIYRDIDRKKKD